MVGAYIRQRRTELGMSLSDLAKRLSERGYIVQRQTVNHWETGRNNAPIESIQFRQALAAAFEIDLPEMLSDMGFSIPDSDRSPEALYVADLIDRLPNDGKELIVEYAQMMETRYLKKIALIS